MISYIEVCIFQYFMVESHPTPESIVLYYYLCQYKCVVMYNVVILGCTYFKVQTCIQTCICIFPEVVYCTTYYMQYVLQSKMDGLNFQHNRTELYSFLSC